MLWEAERAKNGFYTLKCNGQYIYSRYNPKDDAYKFISQNIDVEASEYILLGLGLGYHLEALIELTRGKKIYVLLIEEEEKSLLSRFGNVNLLDNKNIVLINKNIDLMLKDDIQVIIPFSMLNILPNEHKIKSILESIKLNQMSFNLNKERLSYNFDKNIELNDSHWGNLKNVFLNETACLVSSGPSIDDMIPYLHKLKGKCFILCVGSALRIMVKHDLIPDAVVISDAKQAVRHQFSDIEYNGPLFYLATGAHEVIASHKGKRICLFQKGYLNSERKASELGVELIEVGGSVATAGFSILEYLGFKNIILCGQDLGFRNGKTHSTSSTSGVFIKQPLEYKQVLSNNGDLINISKSLNVYLQWFEKKAKTSDVNIINTASNGTKIDGVPYKSPEDVVKEFGNYPLKYFKEIYEV